MRTLAVIAASGLTVAIVCIGAVAAIGVQDGAKAGFDFPMFGPSCGRGDDGGAVTSRTMAWDGSDKEVLAVPGRAHYAPGNDAMLHIKGDAALLSHIRLRDGKIELNCHNWRGDRDDIEVTLPGRTFRAFAIAGSGRLVLDGLSQQDLKVSIAGSGDVRANGQVEHLEVRIAGSGDADLGAVKSDDVNVRIAGSGNADIAPRQKAAIRIAGSGDVTLHSYPADLDTHIAGSGRIRHAEDGI